jgi:hypothetical protein
MSASAEISVFGVRDALKELGKIDKDLRWKAISKIKAASGEMVAVARDTYPDNSQLQDAMSGWSTKGRLGYDKSKVDRGITVMVGGRSFGDAYAIVTLVQKNAGGALFDIAGLQGGSRGVGDTDRLGRSRDNSQSDAFLRNLNNGFGKAQRGMWRKIRVIRELADKELMKALEEVAAQVNRKLVA